MTVFTIGYEGIGLESFLQLLSDYNIDTVVDVREIPHSRKPGFSKKALASALNLSGLDYVHMVHLGCPKPVRDRYREDGDWKRYVGSFVKHLKTQNAAITELTHLVGLSSCALLCYEADYRACHRSIVADELSESVGVDVIHIEFEGLKKANPVSPRSAFAWADRAG